MNAGGRVRRSGVLVRGARGRPYRGPVSGVGVGVLPDGVQGPAGDAAAVGPLVAAGLAASGLGPFVVAVVVLLCEVLVGAIPVAPQSELVQFGDLVVGEVVDVRVEVGQGRFVVE